MSAAPPDPSRSPAVPPRLHCAPASLHTLRVSPHPTCTPSHFARTIAVSPRHPAQAAAYHLRMQGHALVQAGGADGPARGCTLTLLRTSRAHQRERWGWRSLGVGGILSSPSLHPKSALLSSLRAEGGGTWERWVVRPGKKKGGGALPPARLAPTEGAGEVGRGEAGWSADHPYLIGA